MKPVRATNHCRHYSYYRGDLSDQGPRCAAGIDLTGRTVMQCMPSPKEACASRAEYTDAEREAWGVYINERLVRLSNAVAVIPHPVPMRTQGTTTCPNCGGTLGYSRWMGGAEIRCTTADCCGAQFSIEGSGDWPERRTQT